MTLYVYDKESKTVIENVVHIYSSAANNYNTRLHIEYKLQDGKRELLQCDDVVIKE